MSQFFFGLLAGIIVGLVMEWVIDWTGLFPKRAPRTRRELPIEQAAAHSASRKTAEESPHKSATSLTETDTGGE